MKKRIRIFAGPNGSGKSHLILALSELGIPVDPIVNADEVLKELNSNGCLNLSAFNLRNVTQQDWETSLTEVQEVQARSEIAATAGIDISANTVQLNPGEGNSYTAALITDFVRYKMLENGLSYSFETVMSHPMKLSFMKYAQSKGYLVYLYYVGTSSPEINIQRVANRVQKGGHFVPEDKITSRYHKSMSLLLDALKIADRAFVLDNSGEQNQLLLEKAHDGMVTVYPEEVPAWLITHVLEKI